ncbi:phage tail length tape measure family protein [Sphaerochaeta sp.]|uniref:phage tail length tape measure family protein n=1 Tax=Sphaerochaeta sp. TaxID=1972642 RepID=UPI003D102AE0
MAKDLRIKVSSDTAQAEAGLKKVGSAIDGMGTGKAAKDMGSYAASLVRTGIAAAGISLSLAKVVSTAKEAISLYAIQAKAETSLAAAIRATGQESEYTIGELKELASSLQSVTNYGDEAILPITQLMLQTKKIGSDIMPQATEAVLDMSTALGNGVSENARKLARALANPVEGISLLKESMVILSGEQQASIRKFVEQGDVAKAQKIILDQLAATYGGLARAQGELDVSKIEQISNTIGDIKENLGQTIIDSLSPAMTWLLEKLQDVNDKIAQANRESGLVSPSDMSNDELHRTWEALTSKVERYRDQVEKAKDIGDFSTEILAQGFLDEILASYDPVVAEINKRAREAGYASANAFGKAYAERIARQGIENPQTPQDEKASMRFLTPSAMIPSSTGIAKDAAREARELLSAREEAYRLVTSTEGYQRLLVEQENKRLEALRESNLKALENKNLTDSQAEGYRELNRLLNEQLELNSKLLGSNSSIDTFIETNSAYARETAEQEKARLLNAYDIARAYQRQTDLTDEQRKNIDKIVLGIQKALQVTEVEGKKTASSVKEEIEEAFEDLIPTTGVKAIAQDIQQVLGGMKDFLGENFGDITAWGTNVINVMVEAQQKAAEAQIRILEKQMAAEKKLQEKQTKAINSQYDARTQTLADKYAWGMMSYEDYIAAQLALDEEKTASEEAAASRYEELEKEKERIQNEVSKKAFENQKTQSISQALILGAQAILQGYATLGPIGGSIAAAVIGGVTAAQIATISSQQYTPSTALAEGGIVYRPTTALIGEGGEPEAVVPLSKAADFGFGSNGGPRSQVTNVYVTGPTYTGDQLAESIAEGIARGQRIGRIARWEE